MQAATKPIVKKAKKETVAVVEVKDAPMTPPATPEEEQPVEHTHLSVDDLMSVLANYKKNGNFRLVKKRVYKKKAKESSEDSN